MCAHFGIETRHDTIQLPKDNQTEWLRATAEEISIKTIYRKDPGLQEEEEDEAYMFHRAFIQMGFLYVNLREAIRYENGPEIIRMWRYWLLYFLGAGKTNYSSEAANLLVNLAANWPSEIAYIHTHCRTVNMQGKPGRGKPVYQQIEHYNL